jgi:hypothetical protein
MVADQTPATNTNVKGAAGSSIELPSAFSLFKPSWEGLKLNLTELIIIFVVPTLILILLFVVGASMANSSSGGAAVLIVLGVVVGLVYAALIGPAIIHIQLKSSLMEKATYDSALATSKKFWWRFILLSLVVGLVVVSGFILFIIPGIIFLKRYYLSHYALIDQDLGLGDSMRKSNELSRDRSMTVYGLLGVDIVINIPSVIPVIGQVITFVLQIAYFCAPAIRYQQLKKLKPVQPAANS